jgi:hypothetical protein
VGLAVLSLKRTRIYREMQAGAEHKGYGSPTIFATFYCIWGVFLLVVGTIASIGVALTDSGIRWFGLLVAGSCVLGLVLSLWQKNE